MNRKDAIPNDLCDALKAIGHETRLALLDIIRANQDCNVSQIEVLSGVGQPALSQQLAVLRKAGLVETRRQAKQIHYRINEARMDEIAGFIRKFGADEQRSATRSAPAPSSGVATFARIVRD